MSSNSDITGLLASLINGTTESQASPKSVRDGAPTSLSKAVTDSRVMASNGTASPQTNASKKGIVLEYIEYDDDPNQTLWWKTNWTNVMKNYLPSFDVSETTANAIADSGITSYPQYRVWILPDNTNGSETIPIVKSGEVINLDSFTVCSVKDAAMSEQLVSGALIRIDFENRLLDSDAYVTTVINNTEEFGRAVFNELEGIISASDACDPCGDSRPSVSHSTGDAVNSGNTKTSLHNAYSDLYRTSGVKKIDKVDIYNRLNSGLQNSRLAIGILANAIEESALDSNIVSDHANRNGVESSIGLWQMNAQSAGRVGNPNSSIQSLSSKLPESIRIPSNSSVIVYFAGGQLAKKKGVSIITPVDYEGGNQDVSQAYDILSNSDYQIDYAIEVAQNMLATITYDASEISAGDWAQWWQIYFEQPAEIHDIRMATASTIALELGVA
jgi:hypothetical protein